MSPELLRFRDDLLKLLIPLLKDRLGSSESGRYIDGDDYPVPEPEFRLYLGNSPDPEVNFNDPTWSRRYVVVEEGEPYTISFMTNLIKREVDHGVSVNVNRVSDLVANLIINYLVDGTVPSDVVSRQ